MSLIFVVDDMAVIREPIAAALRSAGYEAVCANGGKELLSLIRKQVPDLIVLDLSMPDIGGMAVLRALRNHSPTTKTPVVLLTASADKDRIVEAGKLGVHDYVLKSRFSLPELLERVGKYFAHAGESAASASADDLPIPLPRHPIMPGLAHSASIAGEHPPQLLTRDECISRTEKAMQAKTLSGIVAEVISLAASPRSDLMQLAALISRDALLSSRVLRAANSASYATQRGPISVMDDAVRYVGCSVIRNIATSVAIYDAMPSSSGDGFNAIRCWQHSFATALLCEQLTGDSTNLNSGIAYLVGLCHDLGEILIRTCFADEYQQVINFAECKRLKVQELFHPMLGITYGELVLVVLRSVGLPDDILAPIEEFHLTMSKGTWPIMPLARILALADAYAIASHLAPTTSAQLQPFTRAEVLAAVGSDSPPPLDTSLLRSRVISLTTMLARLSPTEEAELMKPLFNPVQTKVCLIRDPSFSHFDPIEMALQMMCVVEPFNGPVMRFTHSDKHQIMILSAGAEFDQKIMESVIPVLSQSLISPRMLWASRGLDKEPGSARTGPLPVSFPLTLNQIHEFITVPGI